MPTLNVTLPLNNIEVAGQTIKDFEDKLKALIPRALRTAARNSERRLKEVTPVSKRPWERAPGGLRASMHVYHSTDDMTAKWETDYASYIDKGTLPHKVSGDMHWQPAPGVWAHSTGHQVSGIPAQNLTEKARQIMREELETAIITLILYEFQGAGGQ